MSEINDQDWQALQVVWDYLLVESDLPNQADAIVVGGSGNMVDAAQRAATLVKQGVSGKVIVSGFANPYVEATLPEADLLVDELLRCGVSEGFIVKDDQARNTGENIFNAAKILSDKRLEKVILVHKPYMTRRFLATAEAQWPSPQPELFVTSQPTTLREYYLLNCRVASGRQMIEMMLGDYQRIKEYPAKGFSTEQPFSEAAEKAFQSLVKRGFSGKAM